MALRVLCAILIRQKLCEIEWELKQNSLVNHVIAGCVVNKNLLWSLVYDREYSDLCTVVKDGITKNKINKSPRALWFLASG